MSLSLRYAATLPALCLALLGSGCHSRPSATAVPGEEAHKLLLDRNWIDRLPESSRDRLHVFRFVPSMGGGVYQDRTLYAGLFELFSFDHDGEAIRFHLHHTGELRSAGYTIERLPAGDDSPFELHLYIPQSPRGPKNYYSLRNTHATGDSALEAELRNLFTQPGKPN
jgi:hypothetical protein